MVTNKHVFYTVMRINPGIINVTLLHFQSISYPRHSFLMTFQTLEGITKKFVTLKFY